MEIFIAALLFVIGIALIVKGGDWFVDGAIWVAEKTGIPSIIIGATVVSIGTTIPEICVSVIAVVQGLADPSLSASLNEMAVGNAVGSMLCNISLVLALVVAVRPPAAEKSGFKAKALYLVAVTALLTVFALTGAAISVAEGAVLLVLFAGFIVLNVLEAKRALKNGMREAGLETGDATAEKKKPVVMIVKLLLGAAGIGVGAKLLVDKGQFLAEIIGIPTQIVAVTFVAIGTCLPEMVTSITSLRKKDSDIGVGNIIGANIINSTLLLGLVSVIGKDGLPIDYVTRTAALAALMAITLVLTVPALIKQKTYRWQGFVMFGLYCGFMAYNIYYVVASFQR